MDRMCSSGSCCRLVGLLKWTELLHKRVERHKIATTSGRQKTESTRRHDMTNDVDYTRSLREMCVSFHLVGEERALSWKEEAKKEHKTLALGIERRPHNTTFSGAASTAMATRVVDSLSHSLQLQARSDLEFGGTLPRSCENRMRQWRNTGVEKPTTVITKRWTPFSAHIVCDQCSRPMFRYY